VQSQGGREDWRGKDLAGELACFMGRGARTLGGKTIRRGFGEGDAADPFSTEEEPASTFRSALSVLGFRPRLARE
jgi:hypothetical protein